MTEYVLDSLSTISGTFYPTLYSNVAGLTVPASNTILSIGSLEESADESPAVQTTNELVIEIRDDYENHASGFWYKALSQEDAEIKILIDEGDGTQRYFFWGAFDSLTIDWREHFISGNEYYRTATFRIRSITKKVLETPTTDWITEAISHAVSTVNYGDGTEVSDGSPYSGIPIKKMFASLLKASGLNASADESDVSFYYSPDECDIRFGGYQNAHNISIWFSGYEKIYFPYQMYLDGSVHTFLRYGTADSNYYGNLYPLSGGLLTAFLRGLGLVVRIVYNVDTSTFQMGLYQRGRAFAGYNSHLGVPIESLIKNSSDLSVRGVRFYEQYDSTKNYWMSKDATSDDLYSEPPNYAKFDIDQECLFSLSPPEHISATSWDTVGRYLQVVGQDEVTLETIYGWVSAITYWNYTAREYQSVTSIGTTETKDWMKALVRYYYYLSS